MATSSVKIYKVGFEPDKNALIEDLDNYLATLTPVYRVDYTFQYQKIDISMMFDVEVSQDKVATELGNYLVLTQDGKTYYFYILGSNWLSKSAVKLDCEMDTINTFANELDWSDRTQIIRQHKDRFCGKHYNPNTVLTRSIDYVSENFNPPQYKDSQIAVLDTVEPNTKWYLIYRSSSTQSEYEPVNCYCCADKNILVSTAGSYPTESVSSYMNSIPDFNRDNQYLSFIYDLINNPEVQITIHTIGGQDYTYTLSQTTPMIAFDWPNRKVYIMNNDILEVYDITNSTLNNSTISKTRRSYITNSLSFDISFIKQSGRVYLKTIGVLADMYCLGINNYDRTAATNIKIIELAYAPFNIEYDASGVLVVPVNWQYDSNYQLLKLPNINSELLNTNLSKIDFNSDMNIEHLPKVNESPNINYESKLLSSEFSTLKLVYDNTPLLIKNEFLDNYDTNTDFKWDIEYKPSNNISSACGWQIKPHNNAFTYQTEADYGTFLLSQRDNEYPVFNSAWLNYSKYGQKYDKKANNLSYTSNVFGVGATLGSSIALFALGGPGGKALSAGRIAGLIISGIASIANASVSISNTINSQKAKEEELLHQAANVSGINDLNLLKWYNGNALQLMRYSCDDQIKYQVYDYLRLYGYANNTYGIPNVTSRYWYNYIQCDAKFNIDSTAVYNKFIDDIIARYKLGVTVYHNHSNQWDLEQQYENWETSIL